MNADPANLVIIPSYNEAPLLKTVLDQLLAIAAQPRPPFQGVLVVDDGSTDATPEVCRGYPFHYCRHQRCRGVGAGIRTGIEYALSNGYAVVTIMAGNAKDNPGEMSRLVAPVVSGAADYVQGSRFLPGGGHSNMPLSRLYLIRILSAIWSRVIGVRLTDVTNGYRAYRLDLFRNGIDIWQDWLDGYELEYFLHWHVLKRKLRFREVPVTKHYPFKRCTKMRPWDGWALIKPLIYLEMGWKK